MNLLGCQLSHFATYMYYILSLYTNTRMQTESEVKSTN